MNITSKDLYDLIHYEYGVPYTGEHKGMRYYIARSPLKRVIGDSEKEDAQLEVLLWRGPYCREKTPKEQIEQKLFAFSEEGKAQAAAWINEQYNAKPDYWNEGRKLL